MKKIDVVCGALIYDHKVMIAQRNYGSAKGMFEFPGGKVESGETKEEALKREWQEECGIEIENIQPLACSIDYQDNCELHITCFTCQSKIRPENPTVHTKFIWTTPDHIYDYPFFKSDRVLVSKLKEKWECFSEPMK